MVQVRELSTIDKARLLIKAATGEEYGDGYIVTDLIVGYAEPGYGSDQDIVVLGNWNSRDKYDPERPGYYPVTKLGSLPVRLGDALEKIGAHCEWLDEWASCSQCYKAMRFVENSYFWKMYGYYSEHDGYICADCAIHDMESLLKEYVNEPNKCLTFVTGAELSDIGFQEWGGRYQNGWHQGMSDRPEPVYEEIIKEHPDSEVVFLLDEQSQFYISFSAWYRVKESE